MSKKSFRLPFDIASALLLFVCIALVILSLQNPTALDDGLRHFAMAREMRTAGIFQVQGWSTFLYEGYFHGNPVDPWFLSDVLLIPFTYLPIAKGLQLFVLCEVACLFTAFLLVLRSLQVPQKASPIFFLLLVFGDTQFMGRFLFGRPYALMTAVSLFVLYALLERRWILLTCLLAVSVLLSQLFVFPLLFCLCALAVFLFQRLHKESLLLCGAIVGGIAMGFLLHPQTGIYLQYLFTVFFRIPFLQSIGLSREMQSGIYDNATLSLLVCVMAGILLIARLVQLHSIAWFFRKTSVQVLTLCAVFPVMGFLFWVRAIDLAWPVLLLWFASLFALDPTIPRSFYRTLLPKKTIMTQILLWAFTAGCIAEILVLPYIFIRDDETHSLKVYETLQMLPAHSRVLNLDWDHFFAYIAVRPDLLYAMGIDRAFTYIVDPEVSTIVYGLEKNRYPTSNEDILTNMNAVLLRYPSNYLVLSHRKFDAVIRVLQKNPKTKLLSDNGTIAIFSVEQ